MQRHGAVKVCVLTNTHNDVQTKSASKNAAKRLMPLPHARFKEEAGGRGGAKAERDVHGTYASAARRQPQWCGRESRGDPSHTWHLRRPSYPRTRRRQRASSSCARGVSDVSFFGTAARAETSDARDWHGRVHRHGSHLV